MTLYAAQRISLALLEEHDLCVLHKPKCSRTRPWEDAYGVIIECRTPLEYWSAIPSGIAQARFKGHRLRWHYAGLLGKPAWLEWDSSRKLFCAPEHIAECKQEYRAPWFDLIPDYACKQNHLWMTHELPLWGRQRFMERELQAETKAEATAPAPTRIILHTNERNCGYCPISLACMQGRALAYPSAFYFTMCPRCHCLQFTVDTHISGSTWLCAILRWRNEKDAEDAVRRAVFGIEKRGLLTAGLSCISKWQLIEDFERIGPNKLMPAHTTRNHAWYSRKREFPVSTYDCVDYLQERAATENIPLVVY